MVDPKYLYKYVELKDGYIIHRPIIYSKVGLSAFDCFNTYYYTGVIIPTYQVTKLVKLLTKFHIFINTIVGIAELRKEGLALQELSDILHYELHLTGEMYEYFFNYISNIYE